MLSPLTITRYGPGVFALLLCMLPCLSISAEPVINEFLASNTTDYPDNSDFDDYSDWIELYNPDGVDLPLANYYLTDNLDQPFKWPFPGDAVIPAGGYLTVRADGYDAGPGETHVRGYYPWGSTFTTRWYHTNFKLSADGEAIGLFRNGIRPQSVVLIDDDAIWKYHDLGTDPGGGWMQASHDDSGWRTGTGQFGYGEDDETTVISYGPDSGDKFPTSYFRHHFTIVDPALVEDVRLSVLVDDGAVLYLNGTELARIRMGEGSIGYQDFATVSVTTALENLEETVNIPAHRLLEGDNILAVEVHQHSPTSSDLSFSARLEGVEVSRTTLVPLNAEWRYLDTGTDPGPDWMNPAYSDSSWAQGPAQLGYGDGDEATTVSYGPNGNDKYPTTYFRHHFSVDDPAALGEARFRVLVDDGAVVYLNGEEVARLRMSEGSIGYRDNASELGEEGAYDLVEFPLNLLLAGNNVLAVEVHQYDASSSDISFDAELSAREVNGTPKLVDAITFGLQTTDVSYGRNPDNPANWSFYGEPTPGGANTTAPAYTLDYAPSVSVTHASGFYQGSISVGLESGPDVIAIRYTLDGSTPTFDSTLYAGPIPVWGTTVLRARAYVSGLIPGPVVTRSFFIGEPEGSLPVVSMVADPEVLFDDAIGIYENDTPFPYKGREVPVRVEFFESGQDLAFSVNAGARIGGENIWRSAQKPLNVTMRGKYGDDVIVYQVFPGEAVGLFDKLRFRNGGDNWSKAMLRDAMIPSILDGRTDCGLSSYRPCVLFLNGDYWGIYNIRKKLDESYYANEHYLAEGSYDVVQYAHDETGAVSLLAEIGTTESYLEFMAYIGGVDAGDPAAYAGIKTRMNVDSFIDSIMAIDFSANTSWRHNREFWSTRADGSGWQWNITDLDRGFDTGKLGVTLINDFISDYPLFRELTASPDFVDRLLQRYAAHLGSSFHPQRVADILDRLSAEVDGEIQRHIDRWKADGGIPSLATRQAELDEIKLFVQERPSHALSHLEEELGLNRGRAGLTVACSPEDGGNIRVAGVPVDFDYNDTLQLFRNTPVELVAEPAPGYVFAGWSTGSTDPDIVISLEGARTLTALFESGQETLLPTVINDDRRLNASGSPYTFNGDLTIAAGCTLTVDPGVQLLIPKGCSIYVFGTLMVNGTAGQPVELLSRGRDNWGTLNFVDTSGASRLSHLMIRGTGRNPGDPVNLKAAISCYNAVVHLDHVDIEAPLPVFCRFGSTTLTNCTIQTLFTGDGINVKSGSALVEDSTFMGNEFPDTDAIDYDDVVNGIIRGNRIYAFRGVNSDAIDIGEGSKDLLVSGNRIFNITDKGVSVGQASTAWIENNLIVDCGMGVGIKDTGSTAFIDQNTFANVDLGVAVYEKNRGNGGGIAQVSNCIFSRTKDKPVLVDDFSDLSVRYSLSDTILIEGIGNFRADPGFTDPGNYDFSVPASSPAIDSGDPAHPVDEDGTRADVGAYYTYDPLDYPFLVPNVLVINEVLAHSHDSAPDWIELYNNSSSDMDIGGWFLSDDPDVPEKYRFADGTIVPAGGYIVVYEDLDFGEAAGSPGALIPFGLSENGDSVNLFGPGDGLRPDYTARESFGASMTGVSLGRIYKTSTATYNFVAMETPTPGGANGKPLTGPVVISEIMYHPVNGDAEYIELVNMTDQPVTLFDFEAGLPWRMTDGISFDFPSIDPVSLLAGERILLVRDLAAFNAAFTVPGGTRIFQWESGGLSNSGETLQLSRPGDVDDEGQRHYIRVDRVKYSDETPWPDSPDGDGASLVRNNEQAYGNDVANWTADNPSPGETAFQSWARSLGIPVNAAGPDGNPDGDQWTNLEEYGFGTNPVLADPGSAHPISVSFDANSVSMILPPRRPDILYQLQSTISLQDGSWQDLPTGPQNGNDGTLILRVDKPGAYGPRFYRLLLYLVNR